MCLAIQGTKLCAFLIAHLLIPPNLRHLQLSVATVFAIVNCLVLVLSAQFKKYIICMISFLYVLGSALNVFIVLDELSKSEISDQSYLFSLIYFATSMFIDLVVYALILSPSILYPVFYILGYLIGIVVFAISGEILSSHNC